MAVWETVTSGLDYGGYVAWENAITAAEGDHGHDHAPVFFELQPSKGGPGSLLEAIDATLALTDVRFSRHERDLLKTEAALAVGGGWPHPVRSVAFVQRARMAALPEFWSVLNVGPSLAIPDAVDPSPGEDLRVTAGDLDPAVPLVAVIDDGIGFLNARFRKDRAQTRIRAVWLQTPERVADPDAAPRGDVVCGRVLKHEDVDAHLATGGDEAEIYARVNRTLLPVTDGALTNRRTAHGTHVLDLAAGATPWSDDAVSDMPILAVQLPPATVRETAGRRMEAYLVQGLRWILAEALRQANHTDVPPVVINLSLGSLAGPGDRHAFLADWFAYEIARHTRITGGAEVRLVIAYGNARLSRLAARGELRLSQSIDLLWRVQPDDHSSSYLELRVDSSMAAGLKLTLTPPVGSGFPALDIDWPQAGTGWQLAGPVAMVAGVKEPGSQALVHLSLGPTVGRGPLAATPPGAWRLSLRTTEAEPVWVTARVQRDDTPPGYRTLGRQSWLDHPQGWDWDDELRGYIAPRAASDAPGCPVTREGSCVAYAGADDPRILFVGAARPQLGEPGAAKPTAYSSEGVRHLARPGESQGPTLVAFGEDGLMLPGRRAAGVLSGSVTRMSGTSMAAPLVARRLAQYFRDTPPAQRNAAAERLYLTGKSEWGVPDSRMGHGLLRA
jgi:Subtilase family